jgi:hypothetical protein
LIELYSADPAAVAAATVEFELRRTGADAVLARSAARVSATDLPGRRVADATIATTTVEPGDYTISAVISLNGSVIGKVSRTMSLKAVGVGP